MTAGKGGRVPAGLHRDAFLSNSAQLSVRKIKLKKELKIKKVWSCEPVSKITAKGQAKV